jgi:integral membrane sensor domain MASE1
VLLIRTIRLRAEFRSATEFLAVMGLSGALAPLVGAGLGNAILVRLHRAHSDDWLTWWIGDATGVIVLLPALILTLRRDTDETAAPWRYRRPIVAEYVAFLVASTGLCWWIFAGTHTLAAGHNGYLALTFLPIVWSSVRHGPLATAAMIVMIDVTAVVAFIAIAPNAPDSQVELLDLQLFMIALSSAGRGPS